MKSLVFIHGPNGVGKSTVCRLLHQALPHSAWLESEWARMINPFTLTAEVEDLSEKNISFLLRSYLTCTSVRCVIFNYGLTGPRKGIWERVLEALSDLDYKLIPIVLTCDTDENVRRMASDGRDNGRIQRAVAARHIYQNQPCRTIDTTNLTPDETVEILIQAIRGDD